MTKLQLKQLIREIVSVVAKKKETMRDQLVRAYRQAVKEKDAEKAVYYDDAIGRNLAACVDFDQFKGSAAYVSWKKKHAQEIADAQAEYNRFSYLTEIKQVIAEIISEAVKIGTEEDVRGNLGFFDQFIVHDSIKIIEGDKGRAYVWFIDVPTDDPSVKAELKGADLRSYLANKLSAAGEFNQEIDADVDMVRQHTGRALVKLVLHVQPWSK